MVIELARRMLAEIDPRLLRILAWNMGWKGMRAVNAFKKRLAHDEFFPAFVFMSLTNNCNLRCRGCWVTPTSPPAQLEPDTVERIIRASNEKGSYFFGLLGGEPLLYGPLLPVIERHPDCYFQLFTNGTCLNADFAASLRRLGNVTPLISIEGNPAVSDERRGGTDVYARALQALEHCRQNRLMTGVATSVCRTNIDDLVSESFLDELIRRGVHYMWYYIYRPVGPEPAPELALTREEILRLRRFMVDMRARKPIMIIDAYWDHDGRALCPAGTGVSHHIGPGGDIEPCPPIQFARDNVKDSADLAEQLENSEFLLSFRDLVCATTRGCILLDDPQRLHRFLLEHGARDSSGRGTGYAELEAMVPRPGHDLAGDEIPERHWLYRIAKKHWFFGFGAYG